MRDMPVTLAVNFPAAVICSPPQTTTTTTPPTKHQVVRRGRTACSTERRQAQTRQHGSQSRLLGSPGPRSAQARTRKHPDKKISTPRARTTAARRPTRLDMSPSVSADVFGEQPGLDSIPQATDLPAQSHTTTSLSVGELWAGGGAAVSGDGDDKAAADGTDETGIGRSGATGGGFGGTRDPTTRHPVPGGQQTTQEDGGYFAIPRAPSRGRVRTRATTPRAPTLPIIPSSRASPVLGPVKPGGFAGLGLMTKLSLAAAEDDDDVDDLADRQDEDDARLCAPLHAVVALPPTPRSRGPLHPGATWSGTQRSGRASYGVSVTFTHIDLTRGVGGGYLRISQLTRELPELVTYFDAEIIGDRHGFLTGKYGASESDDWKHWSRFPPFRTLAKPAILKERAELKDKERATQSAKKEDGDGGTASEGSQDGSEADGREEGKPINKMPFAHLNRPVVFMRWKERFVVPNHRTRDIQGASFAGAFLAAFAKRCRTDAGMQASTTSAAT